MGIEEVISKRVRYNSILATPINQILRYGPIVKFLKKIKKKNKNLKILEVGSGSEGITKFVKLPVVGIDVEFEGKPSPYLKPLNHSATKKFPFKDKEFDIVISSDTYEHLPMNKRKITLEEMYRVSRKYVILTTIFGLHKWHKKILETWNKKNRYYQDILEHKRAGFPNTNEIYDFLKNKNCKFKKVYGTHPRLAYYLNLLEQNIFTKIFSRTILKLFLPIFKIYKSKERLYFFIEKLPNNKK